MCGLVGFVRRNANHKEQLSLLEKMSDVIEHRGPDDCGYFSDPEPGCYIGFRRLSIIDLSPAGHQPMFSASGRYCMVMNGEVYNFPQMRELLLSREPDHKWAGHSDTEILLACIEQFGWDETIRKTVGMYAIVLYDRQEKELVLCRDRFGEKPVYYGQCGDTLFFGSELKAFAVHPSWQPKIDNAALQGYLTFGYVPTPRSIYEGISKLEPGHYIRFSLRGNGSPIEIENVQYWSLLDAARAGTANPFTGSQDDALIELEKLLAQTIRLESTADVPVGAFLSGGIDSSVVVALMQRYSGQQVKTFTIGNERRSYDEAGFAKKVAEHLGTCHTELYVSKDDMLAVVPLLAKIYDEPFSDSSQIPTFLVSKLARERVTVSLSGDGGDEVFGGYTRYLMAKTIWQRVQRLPKAVRAGASGMLRNTPAPVWDSLYGAARAVTKRLPETSLPGVKAQKLGHMLRSDSFEAVYRSLITTWDDPNRFLCAEIESPYPICVPEMAGEIERMMVADSLAYLPDDILVKVDRATMANSLESRAPFLDHRIAEFAWSLPISMKIQGGNGKAILKNLLAKHLPPELFERPKQGFGIPIGDWLKSELRGWANELMNESSLWKSGFIDKQAALSVWKSFEKGGPVPQDKIWNLLALADWHQQNLS